MRSVRGAVKRFKVEKELARLREGSAFKRPLLARVDGAPPLKGLRRSNI